MWEWRTIARSPALPSGGMADGEEVQGAVETALAQLEIRGGDRGGEAVVERPGQAETLVDRVPTELDRQLMGSQLAGMEEAEQLHFGEVRLAEPAELLRAVLVDVPRVVGLLGAQRRQGEQVRRRDVGDAAWRQHGPEVLEDRPRVLDVLDRLQEDDRVTGLGEALDQVALEAQ